MLGYIAANVQVAHAQKLSVLSQYQKICLFSLGSTNDCHLIPLPSLTNLNLRKGMYGLASKINNVLVNIGKCPMF